MATKTINFGSIEGYHVYDDADYPDGISTDGALKSSQAPTAAEDVLRLDDVPTIAAPSDATFLVVSLSGDLSAERRLQGTANQIALADGGANGDLVLSTPQDIATTSNVTFNSVEIDADLNHDGAAIGFNGAAPTAQGAAIADADGTLADLTAKFNSLLAYLRTRGDIAT